MAKNSQAKNLTVPPNEKSKNKGEKKSYQEDGAMGMYDGQWVLERLKQLAGRYKHVGSNVTLYSGPEIGRIAESTGQRSVFGGHNWDTRVRNRSAKYTVMIGAEAVATKNPVPGQVETIQNMDLFFTRIFGGEYTGKTYAGHANRLATDLVHRVMGSGADPDFTFNCYLLVTVKNRTNHHIPYMWGKMLRAEDPVPGVEDLYMLMVPAIPTGDFGRIWGFPEQNVTVAMGTDFMGEAKKGMLRMAMYRAKQKGILGVHAGAKIVVAHSVSEAKLKRYGVVIFGNSGTGKTTNIGHTHYLDQPGEQSLVVQDDFVGLRLKDGRVLGTEMAMFLKTDLDEGDLLLRPATESPEFVSQNLYIDYLGNIHYLEEDLCANGRGILPLRALPKDRRYTSIDLPPFEELDQMFIIFNTRRNTVVPIFQELTPELGAAYFMLGESIETAAGDPSRAGQSIRIVGTNEFIIGDPGEEGNMFYEYLVKYRDRVRIFLMNTGGVGEIPNPQDPAEPLRPAARPWKQGIGYITRAIFRESAVWDDDPDFGTKYVTTGVYDEKGNLFNMKKLDPRHLYDNATREEMVKALNKERIEYLDRFPNLDPRIREAVLKTHRM
jgi:phosphoenolpyruvate carboxykinase (ATP)